jgi:hypothetical protein
MVVIVFRPLLINSYDKIWTPFLTQRNMYQYSCYEGHKAIHVSRTKKFSEIEFH